MSKPKKPPRGVFVRDGEYWIRYADQFGKMHREKAGPLVSKAVAAYQTRKSEVRAGKFFPDQLKRRPLLFGEIAKEYLKLAKARKRSWRDDEDHLQTLKTLNDVPIADLTPVRIEAAISDVAEEREWKKATFNRHKSTVSGVFKYAIRAGQAQMNPAREIKKRDEENTRVRYLTAEEEASLMKVVREQSPEREAEILVGLHSGMRRSEQYRTAQVKDGGLKWEHLNLRAALISLPRSKSSKPRHIPINSVLKRTLASIPRMISTPLVFSGEPDSWFPELVEKAKIEDFGWHDLRHTFASRLVMAGVPIPAVAELMGHSSITTTMRYAHLAPRYLADAVECLAQNAGATGTATGT